MRNQKKAAGLDGDTILVAGPKSTRNQGEAAERRPVTAAAAGSCLLWTCAISSGSIYLYNYNPP